MYLKLLTISVLIGVIAIYFRKFIYNNNSNGEKSQLKLFTSDELKLYNGIDNPQLYLAILGKVFDVSKGSTHYGPGNSYHFFVGRDGSRSFVTGRFDEDEASDEVADLTPEELRSLNHWVQFYRKEYSIVGKLIGRYYRENGKLTPYGREVKKLIKAAERAQEDKDRDKLKYPPCNVEWDAVRGSRVWCSRRSGGIERDWVGVPRQLYEPGSKDYRCACVLPELEDTPQLKEYEGCDSESDTCFVKT